MGAGGDGRRTSVTVGWDDSPHLVRPPGVLAWVRDHPIWTVLLLGPVCALLAVLLDRRATYDPPDGIGVRPIDTVELGSIAWSAAWLWLLSGLLVLVLCTYLWRCTMGALVWLGLVSILVGPLVAISVVGVRLTSLRGCGAPYRELVEPLPSDVEIVSEEVVFEATSGAGRYRDLVVRRPGSTTEELLPDVVEALEATGWSMEELPLDQYEGGLPGRSSSALLGAEWSVLAGPGDPQYGRPAGSVVISLSHWPDDAEACWNT